MASVLVAFVLAVGLCPVVALASPLATGEVAQSAKPSKITPQAAKKTIYVLVGIVGKENSRSKDGYSGKLRKSSTKTNVSFAYNDKGLLKKSRFKDTHTIDGKKASYSPRTTTKTWTYNKKNQLVSVKKEVGTWKFSLDGKGRFKTATLGEGSVKVKYSYGKSGKTLTKKSFVSGSSSTVSTYRYDASGRPLSKSEAVKYGGTTHDHKTSFSYDKQGNLPCNNEYNAKGLLVKRSSSSQNANGTGSSETVIYKYKRISVSSSLVAKVRAQQWALLNHNLNLVIDPHESSSSPAISLVNDFY